MRPRTLEKKNCASELAISTTVSIQMDAPPATESEERPASPSPAPSSAAAAAAPLDSPAPSEGGPAPGTATAPALDLPRSSVRKTVKAALAGTAPGGGDVAVSKEALGALGECAKVCVRRAASRPERASACTD